MPEMNDNCAKVAAGFMALGDNASGSSRTALSTLLAFGSVDNRTATAVGKEHAIDL
jgi:hypothetical protein